PGPLPDTLVLHGHRRWVAGSGDTVTCLLFFVFQAEDGIRDPLVTGVQTCALPIYQHHRESDLGYHKSTSGVMTPGAAGTPCAFRSEERRVGKECRGRWSGAR